MNFTKLLVAVFFTAFVSAKAQQVESHNNHGHDHIDEFYLPLEFDKDSLKGFNEEAAWQQAKMNTNQEWRQKRFVAVLKRNFIDFKYGFSKVAPDPVVQGPCSNPDFENGTLSGWTATQGQNNNSSTMAGCCPNTTSQIVVVTPGTDPNVPAIQRVPPGGGNFACRLGPTGVSSGGTSYRMSQSFTVTPANSVFIYKYAVLLNKAPHSCSEQPFFNVSFKDCSGNPIPCGQYNVTAIGSSCSSGDPSFVTSGSWAYKNWTTNAFDLTAYIGQCVKLEFTVAGCVVTQGAHGGYAYIDASCQPFTLNLNGTDIPVGQTNNSFCGASTTNTLCAPPGFDYSWSGPGVTGQTSQCINTNSVGTYSVTLGVPGTTCAFNPVLYSTFNSVPNPTVSASVTQPVCALPAGTASISVNGGTGPFTYSWSPAAPADSVNTNLPTGSMYTVSVVDDNGCTGSTTFSVDPYPPAPEYTLSVVPSYVLSCSSPSTTISFASTNTTTTSQWDGPSGAMTGTTAIVTSPGVYTYTTINTVSTCSLTGSINITGAVNFPVLTSTVTQPSCAAPFGSATISATNGTAPYTYSWSPTVTAPSDSINTNLPPGTSYTVTVTDALGCSGFVTVAINTFTSSPSYTLNSNPGLVLSCLSPSTTLTFAPTNTNTSTSWQGPSGNILGTDTLITTAGTYSYTAINTISTCSVTGVINVTGTPVYPVVTSTVTQPSCSAPYGTGTVSATNGSTPYTYSWSPTVSFPADSVNTNLPPGTSYSISVTDALGCTGNTTISINNFSGSPSFTLNSNPGLLLTCSSPSTTLTFAPTNTNTSTSWTGPSGAISGTDTIVTTAGTYSYIAVNAVSTCTTSGTMVVTVNKQIPSATPIVGCNPNTVTLDATSSPGINLNWVAPTSPTTSIGNPAASTSTGIFTLTAVDPANGCFQTYTVSTFVPPINVVTTPATNVITCNTPTIQATTSSSTSTFVTTWSNGITTFTGSALPITASGTYTTIVQVPGGCSSQSVITVSTNTVVNVNITTPSTIIPCSTGSLVLTANSSVGGPYVYVWSPGAPTFTGSAMTVTNVGTYTVVALNTANGCTATATEDITRETVNASFIADQYQGLTPFPVTFTNTSVNVPGTSYSWDFGDGTSLASNATVVSTVYNQHGSYPVILTAKNGVCSDTAMRTIKVDIISYFIIPNVFTPNGDGRNDVFTFDAVNMGEITLTIFDRWGLKMFDITGSGNVKWDGKNKGGAMVTDGTYFYIVKATALDGTTYDQKGTVNVFQ